MKACRVAGISARTIERWRKHPKANDGRCGPHRRPRNALTPTEEALIISLMRSSRFAHLSPKQLVPQLADEGLYLGSEATFCTLIATLQWLGVVPSFSRPHVSDDNPYSEALFRTLKHTQAYPRLPFASLAAA
jgi:transposase InsO family protein